MSSGYPLLEKLNVFEKKHIEILDPATVEEKIAKIVDGGFSKLQVVADYDYTLTRVRDENGERCHCSWGALDEHPIMPDFYRAETAALLEKYYPIEISHTMTEAEKLPYMVEWYENVVKLLGRCKITLKDIEKMVAESTTQLRDGTVAFLKVLEVEGVPVLVLSAGMGDVIERFLHSVRVDTPNLKIVSNFFKYDDEGYFAGFAGEMIHMLNKNENAIHSSSYFERLAPRSNVILMGDSLGDIKMTHGLPDSHNILRIGYLNDKIERLDTYKKAYDVVLWKDETVELHQGILDLMSAKNH